MRCVHRFVHCLPSYHTHTHTPFSLSLFLFNRCACSLLRRPSLLSVHLLRRCTLSVSQLSLSPALSGCLSGEGGWCRLGGTCALPCLWRCFSSILLHLLTPHVAQYLVFTRPRCKSHKTSAVIPNFILSLSLSIFVWLTPPRLCFSSLSCLLFAADGISHLPFSCLYLCKTLLTDLTCIFLVTSSLSLVCLSNLLCHFCSSAFLWLHICNSEGLSHLISAFFTDRRCAW